MCLTGTSIVIDIATQQLYVLLCQQNPAEFILRPEIADPQLE